VVEKFCGKRQQRDGRKVELMEKYLDIVLLIKMYWWYPAVKRESDFAG
jgi:hypothetical protein